MSLEPEGFVSFNEVSHVVLLYADLVREAVGRRNFAALIA